ncbi:MAG: hypothetical protein AAFX10_03810, partial [Pseudomonadota bacterium]
HRRRALAVRACSLLLSATSGKRVAEYTLCEHVNSIANNIVVMTIVWTRLAVQGEIYGNATKPS